LVKMSAKNGAARAPEVDAEVAKAVEEELQLNVDETAKVRGKRGNKRARPA